MWPLLVWRAIREKKMWGRNRDFRGFVNSFFIFWIWYLLLLQNWARTQDCFFFNYLLFCCCNITFDVKRTTFCKIIKIGEGWVSVLKEIKIRGPC